MTRGRKPEPVALEVAGVPLTEVDIELMRCIATGRDSDKAMARELCLSAFTVNQRLCKLYRKLGVSTRVQAAVWAVRNGVA